MTKKITIHQLKHINKIEFNIPDKHGVYVLTGSNGSGKTTLMTCLLRIGQGRAFQDNFKVGTNNVDAYNGHIAYEVGSETVRYHYRRTRWPSIPKKNSRLLSKFDFAQVRYLPPMGNRLFVHDQNITSTDVQNADAALKADMNRLLETDKFQHLRFIQTASLRGRGSGSQRWKRAYVIKTGTNQYYSERNFSLGEIIILNTLLLIQDVPNNAMLLIDEVETALHPRVQAKLLEYLAEKAEAKKLTVFISTHSASLIKAAKNLIYLEKKADGNITVNYHSYPATILREVAIEEDMQPDYLFSVEDDMAQMLLKSMIGHYFQLHPDKQMPLYKVIPLGGYPQLFDFADTTSDYLFSAKIGQYVFPDFDVTEVLGNLRTVGNSRSRDQQSLFEQFNRHSPKIKYLPITPELGLWNWLTAKCTDIQRELIILYPDISFNLKDLIDQTNANFPTDSDSERKKAKRRVKFMVELLANRVNENKERVTQNLFGKFVLYYCENQANLNQLKQMFGQIFNTRGNPR